MTDAALPIPEDQGYRMVIARLLDLNAKIADLTAEAEGLKATLRTLPAPSYDLGAGRTMKLTPSRKFDPVKALALVPHEARASCYVLTLDAAKVKQLITPDAAEECMVENGKARVTFS